MPFHRWIPYWTARLLAEGRVILNGFCVTSSSSYTTGVRTKSGVIPVNIRLAVALRILAGASYLDVMVLFGLGQTTVFTIMWEVVDAINKTPAVGGFFFPQTEADCQLAAGRWQVRSCSSSNSMTDGGDSDTCGRDSSLG